MMGRTMSLADLVEEIRARIARRNATMEPVYYTLHDAWVDRSILEEINLLRLDRVEARTLADATSKNPPIQQRDRT